VNRLTFHFFHCWSKWSEAIRHPGFGDVAILQRKICSVCGKVKLREAVPW
jgi:hypothetical protein